MTATEARRWLERNTHPHKVAGYKAVTLSLKKHGVPPGDITAEQMEAVADLADRYSFGELRTTHEQNIVLADVRQDDLHIPTLTVEETIRYAARLAEAR